MNTRIMRETLFPERRRYQRVDCFGKHKLRDECTATENNTCDNCNFYKTHYDHMKIRQKCKERCKKLELVFDDPNLPLF